MKAPARAEAGRVLRMARSASECQMSDGMGDGPLGWGATDRARQNMPRLSGSPAFLVTLSSHTLRRDLMKITGTPLAYCPEQSTLLAARLPHDFGIEMRGKVLKLIGKMCRSSECRNFTNYTSDSRTLAVPDQYSNHNWSTVLRNICSSS